MLEAKLGDDLLSIPKNDLSSQVFLRLLTQTFGVDKCHLIY